MTGFERRNGTLTCEGVPLDEIAARCGSEDHQGVCADAGEYPYVPADQLLSEPDPLIVVPVFSEPIVIRSGGT